MVWRIGERTGKTKTGRMIRSVNKLVCPPRGASGGLIGRAHSRVVEGHHIRVPGIYIDVFSPPSQGLNTTVITIAAAQPPTSHTPSYPQVDTFNDASNPVFVLLLSSKAGGVSGRALRVLCLLGSGVSRRAAVACLGKGRHKETL